MLWFDDWSINAMSLICEDLGRVSAIRWGGTSPDEDVDDFRFASRSCRMPPVTFDVSRLRVAFNVKRSDARLTGLSRRKK